MVHGMNINRGPLTRRAFMHVGMWAALGLLLLSLYGRWLIDATPEALRPAWHVFGPFLLLTDFLNVVIFSQFWFFFFFSAGLLACVLLWLWGGRLARTVSALILGTILVSPFAITQIYDQYALRSVVVARGYELDWLTQPEGRFASAFKTAQREHDVLGCKNRLHGWNKDSQLFYGSNCSNDLWMYDPQKGENPQRIQRLPHDFEPVSPMKTWHIRPSGQGGLSVSRVVEESRSIDGKFKAFVIQDSLYGPFDVLVMRRDAPD